MDKKTKKIVITAVVIVVIVPILLILLGMGAFIIADLIHFDDGKGIGILLKILGVAILVIGVPLILFLPKKKE